MQHLKNKIHASLLFENLQCVVANLAQKVNQMRYRYNEQIFNIKLICAIYKVAVTGDPTSVASIFIKMFPMQHEGYIIDYKHALKSKCPYHHCPVFKVKQREDLAWCPYCRKFLVMVHSFIE